MLVYSALIRAQIEATTGDATGALTGHMIWNTNELRLSIADGTNARYMLRNDQKCIFGNNGTAANNVRFQRGGDAVLQFVLGSDATAEGSLSNTIAEISHRADNYTTAGRPTATTANTGRVIYDTDIGALVVNTAAPSWVTVGGGVSDHGALTGLADDDHTQYALLTGRSGGQTFQGGTAANNDVRIESTSNGTKGSVFLGSSGSDAEIDEDGYLLEKRLVVSAIGLTQAITTGSTVVIGSDASWSEVFDNKSAFAAGGAVGVAGRLTVPTGFGGKYWVSCTLVCQGIAMDADEAWSLSFRLKAATQLLGAKYNSEATSTTARMVTCSGLVDLAAGSDYEFYSTQNSGNTMTMDGGKLCHIHFMRVSD